MMPPPLAYHKSIRDYKPQFGDFIIWKKWFSTQYGVVNGVDLETDIVSVIFEATPMLLFTLDQDEMAEKTYLLRLSNIRSHKKGRFYISQETNGKQVWHL